jgi:uncharacterized NAD-dependent epimerase/dehydratase family protein
METAIILCDGYFGTYTGKTANGLVRYSKRFRILGVIDSHNVGRDAGDVLGEGEKDIPVFKDLDDALGKSSTKPDWMIIGVASIGGMLPKEFRPVVNAALDNGLNVISGLHEFLGNDTEFSHMAAKRGVKIVDIRKEPPIEHMHAFMNRCVAIPALRIPVLGTDSSIGKRTTALLLADALNDAGIKTEFVATGQTGLLQGASYGVPLDAIQGDYMVGELENAIVSAYETQKPRVILIEGQGSISHPAYVCGTRAIINASRPSALIVQHAPGRKTRNYKKDILKLPMPDLQDEIDMLEMFSKSKVIAITLNHENINDEDISAIEKECELMYCVPTQDVMKHGCGKLVERIRKLVDDDARLR